MYYNVFYSLVVFLFFFLVLMRAAELLQLFHHVLPKAASCAATAMWRRSTAQNVLFCSLIFKCLVVAGALMRGEFLWRCPVLLKLQVEHI